MLVAKDGFTVERGLTREYALDNITIVDLFARKLI